MRFAPGFVALLVCASALHCGGPQTLSEPMDAGDDGDPDPGDAGLSLPPDSGVDDSQPDAGADADAGGDAGGGAGGGGGFTGILAGDELRATTDVTLRTGPATTYPVILVIPKTGVSKALAAESGGWVQADYAARTGYTSARYEQVVPAGSGADLGSTFIARGMQSVGFNYWWGDGAWTSNSTDAPGGTCTGTCPSCTHTGSDGAHPPG